MKRFYYTLLLMYSQYSTIVYCWWIGKKIVKENGAWIKWNDGTIFMKWDVGDHFTYQKVDEMKHQILEEK